MGPPMKYIRMIFLVSAVIGCTLANASAGEKQECVGYASIDAAGIIHLNLFTKEQTHGGAMLVLEKKNSLYAKTRKHIGKIGVGKWKGLKSMPEAPASEAPAKE
jgi:hypothetical protein